MLYSTEDGEVMLGIITERGPIILTTMDRALLPEEFPILERIIEELLATSAMAEVLREIRKRVSEK